MSFTDDERSVLKTLVEQELALFREEGKTLLEQDNPVFSVLEDKYEEFLETLIKKL